MSHFCPHDDDDSDPECIECGTTVSVDDACETCKFPLCESCAFIGLGCCTSHRMTAAELGTGMLRQHYHRKTDYSPSLSDLLRRKG